MKSEVVGGPSFKSREAVLSLLSMVLGQGHTFSGQSWSLEGVDTGPLPWVLGQRLLHTCSSAPEYSQLMGSGSAPFDLIIFLLSVSFC